MYLFEIYNQLLKKKKAEVVPFAAKELWPKAWQVITKKTYERFPLVQLPVVKEYANLPLTKAILKRESRRDFSNQLSEEDLSRLLYFSLAQKDASDKRMYPSAGSRYSLEAYLILFRAVGEIPCGVYHYDITHNGLRIIRDQVLDPEEIIEATAERCLTKACGAVVLTAFPGRVSTKYLEKTYKYIILEAGAVLQNISLLATDADIDALLIGTFAEDVIEPLLDIDGTQETYVQSIFFG